MNTQLPKLVFAVLATLSLATAPALCGAPAISFETIALTHLTAAEVAPLLGPHFQFLGQPVAPTPRPTRGSLADFVPEGIELITAGHHSSHNILVAGTAESVAQLRALLTQLDAKPQPVRLSLAVYPTVPAGASASRALPLSSGVSIASSAVPRGQRLSFPRLPSGFQPPQISVNTANATMEFVPLPRFADWPQVLLGLVNRINADGSITMSVWAGLLEDPADPEAAVEQARETSLHINLAKDESLALILSRPDSAATVVISPTT
jgi:hypothetical protein